MSRLFSRAKRRARGLGRQPGSFRSFGQGPGIAGHSGSRSQNGRSGQPVGETRGATPAGLSPLRSSDFGAGGHSRSPQANTSHSGHVMRGIPKFHESRALTIGFYDQRPRPASCCWFSGPGLVSVDEIGLNEPDDAINSNHAPHSRNFFSTRLKIVDSPHFCTESVWILSPVSQS